MENDEDFGKCKNENRISINKYTDPSRTTRNIIEDSGKVNAAILAKKIEEQLNPQKETAPEQITITPSIFAFEMLSVPHKAVFSAHSLEEK